MRPADDCEEPAPEHRQHQIDAGQRARPVGDDHDDAAARPHAEDRLRQRLFALGVEVRVGLVEDDEERVAEQGARQGDTLPLAG